MDILAKCDGNIYTTIFQYLSVTDMYMLSTVNRFWNKYTFRYCTVLDFTFFKKPHTLLHIHKVIMKCVSSVLHVIFPVNFTAAGHWSLLEELPPDIEPPPLHLCYKLISCRGLYRPFLDRLPLNISILDIDNNVYPSYYAKEISPYLSYYINLKVLHIPSTDFSDLKHLLKSLRHLHTLTLTCSERGDELDALAFSTSLRSLTLKKFKCLMAVCLIPRTLLYSIHLDFLDSHLFNLHPIYMAQLRFPYLTELSLQNTTVEFLHKTFILRVRKLTLVKCDISALPNMPAPALTHLRLHACTGLPHASHHRFLLNFPELRRLEFADIKGIGGETLVTIARCAKLASFTLCVSENVPSYSLFRCLGLSRSLRVFRLTARYKDCAIQIKKFLEVMGDWPWLDIEISNLDAERPLQWRFALQQP
eukprot:Phypoly_transcript_08881.p1 GENE.Phypoly_transcript_08881~~Phypoly_transcript_08881.p1  ORF type:complete len:419 (+),score=42.25 Phypoly_transcript_08881:86-1342(+)